MREIRLLAWTWPYLRPDAWALGFALAATPLAAGVSLAQPFLLKEAIDRHIVTGVPEGLGRLGLLYLGATVLGYALEAALGFALAWSGQRTTSRLRRAVYARILGFSRAYFDRQPAGRLLTRCTTDLEALGEAFASGVVTVLLDLLLIAGALAAMLWIDARLTVVLLVLAPPLLGILEVVRRRLRHLFLAGRDALAAVNAFLAERIDGIEVVQLYCHESESEKQFQRLNGRFRDATTASNAYDAFLYALVDGTSSILVAAMLWYGTGLLGRYGLPAPPEGVVSAGLLVAFVEYLERLFRPLREFAGKVAVIQRATASLEKIFELLHGGETAPSGSLALEQVCGRVALRDVRFGYREGGEDVLRGVNLEVKRGEVVALVGATGSGKTTITRLLMGEYGGYRGSITVDGQEVRDLRVRDLRRHVAGVPQDTQLFRETLRFNVDLGSRGLTDREVALAAKLVHAEGLAARLGWDHVLKERGVDLSVGEGRLLVFARAMAHDPDVVILDEATASVDSITEALIQDAIARIFERKTVIVVAHRLSTVQKADRIAVVANGRIVEEGSHRVLLERRGHYAALLRAGGAVLGV